MKHKFHVFLRQHWNQWYTASLLSHPLYAAYGPHPSELLEELERAASRDLASGDLVLGAPAWFPKLQRRTLTVALKARQHDRLTTVPMRFTVLTRPLEQEHLFEVRVPRLGSVFTIFGEENIEPWTEETIRGYFHLDPVEDLLLHQYERSERIEEIEVTPRGKKAKRPEEETFRPAESHPLDALAIELTAEAKAGRLTGALFRDAEVERLIGALSSRRAPAVLLIGPSGVGKTALVNQLALQLIEARVPPQLAGARLWQVTGGRLIAGATFLGDWQERARRVVDTIAGSRDVLYLGDLTELISAGSRKSGLDVASFFVAPIEAGEIIVIAEVTLDGLTRAQRTHPELVRAFQHLPVQPMPFDRSRALIDRSSVRLERELGVRFDPGAVSAALELTGRFSPSDAFPGAALDLVDRMARLHSDKKRGLSRGDAVRAFAKISGFPEALVDPDRLLEIAEVTAFFRERVIGQEPATDLLTNLLLILKAGLNDPEKPLGSFLFMGPTGVGKTESALTLAEYLFSDRDRVVRFDMSEYGYPGSAIRLVDGADGQGDLTKRVREQPFSVLLFDEIEKADAGVFDLLLQILGEGRLTDGTGKTVSFVHTIVIMTSNLGAEKKRSLGFEGSGPSQPSRYLEAAERFFRPELVNRIDHLVPFSALSPEDLRRIARRLLDAALAREGFVRRGLTVTYQEELLDHLAEIGFDPRYGARPMKRAVESFVVVPLAKRLIAEPPRSEASALRLGLREGALAIYA